MSELISDLMSDLMSHLMLIPEQMSASISDLIFLSLLFLSLSLSLSLLWYQLMFLLI